MIVIFGRERAGLNGWCSSSLSVLVWQSWRIVVSSINSRMPRSSPPPLLQSFRHRSIHRGHPHPRSLTKNPPPNQSPRETPPPSAHPSMPRLSLTPSSTSTTTPRSTTTSATCRTPTPTESASHGGGGGVEAAPMGGINDGVGRVR